MVLEQVGPKHALALWFGQGNDEPPSGQLRQTAPAAHMAHANCNSGRQVSLQVFSDRLADQAHPARGCAVRRALSLQVMNHDNPLHACQMPDATIGLSRQDLDRRISGDRTMCRRVGARKRKSGASESPADWQVRASGARLMEATVPDMVIARWLCGGSNPAALVPRCRRKGAGAPLLHEQLHHARGYANPGTGVPHRHPPGCGRATA